MVMMVVYINLLELGNSDDDDGDGDKDGKMEADR